MDVFYERAYRPMLIGREAEPFDSDDYSFELKLDGVRCLAYVDGNETFLITRNGIKQNEQFPELATLHENVSGKCVLDGELVVLRNGIPVFEEVKDRALSSRKDRIARMAAKTPVVFVVFDVLYEEGKELLRVPFDERRKRLEAVVEETERLALTRIVDKQGLAFFEAAKGFGLEGIIAKRKQSFYYPGKRTSDWIKCKSLLDDDFIICGYISNKNNTVSLVLGQYDQNGELAYKGRVTMGTAKADFSQIEKLKKVEKHSFANPIPKDNADVTWVDLKLVCRVDFVSRSEVGLRHPVYKDLRIDKLPDEALDPSHPSRSGAKAP